MKRGFGISVPVILAVALLGLGGRVTAAESGRACRDAIVSFGRGLLALPHPWRLSDRFDPFVNVERILTDLSFEESQVVFAASSPEELRANAYGEGALRKISRAEAALLYAVVSEAKREFGELWDQFPYSRKQWAIWKTLPQFATGDAGRPWGTKPEPPKIPDPAGLEFLDPQPRTPRKSRSRSWFPWFIPAAQKAARIFEVREAYFAELAFSQQLAQVLEAGALDVAKLGSGDEGREASLALFRLASEERENIRQLEERGRALFLEGLDRAGAVSRTEFRKKASALYARVRRIDLAAQTDGYLRAACQKLAKLDQFFDAGRTRRARAPRGWNEMGGTELKLRYVIGLSNYARARKAGLAMLREPSEFVYWLAGASRSGAEGSSDNDNDKKSYLPTYLEILEGLEAPPPKGFSVVREGFEKLKSETRWVTLEEKPIWSGVETAENRVFYILRNHGKLVAGDFPFSPARAVEDLADTRRSLTELDLRAQGYAKELAVRISETDHTGFLLFSAGIKRLRDRIASLGALVEIYKVLLERGETRLEPTFSRAGADTEIEVLTDGLRRRYLRKGLASMGIFTVTGSALAAWLYFF